MIGRTDLKLEVNQDIRECSTCGKTFSTTYSPNWAYRRSFNNKVHWYCTWSCLRKEEKLKEAEKNGGDQT